MISARGLLSASLKGSPYCYAPAEAELVRKFIEWRGQIAPAERWHSVVVPTCRCCGEPSWANLRCTKHQDRNPCAVEGCTRTRAARGWLREDIFLCGEHWRSYAPPGSPARRSFNRLARLAKRLGYKRTDIWPTELEDRWWRLWRGLIRRVRRGDEGHIDQAAIEKLFGWSDEI